MKQNCTLDAIDRKILAELQRDAAISNAELGDRVGSSSASCWRRVRTLEANGVLLQSVRLVDPVKVGLSVNVLCNVRMRSHSSEAIASFESFVHARPEVLECYSMSGGWDYLLRIVAADVSGYERFLMRALLEHASVATALSQFALAQTKHTTSLPLC